MKRILQLFALTLACSALAQFQPYVRNDWSTNVVRSTAELSAALAHTKGNEVIVIQPGVYTVQALYYNNDTNAIAPQLYLRGRTNVTVIGNGATLYATNYGNLLTIENCTNVTLDGLTFKYRTMTTNEIGTNHIAAAVNHRQTNWNTTISGCSFVNIPDQAISHCWPNLARPSSKWTIVNNYFENIGTTNHPTVGMADGAMVSGRPREMIFSGNRSEGLNVYAVELDGGGTGSPPDDFGNVVLTDNVLRGIYRHGFVASGTTNCPISGIIIANNFMEFATNGYGALVNLSCAYDALLFANRFRGNVAISGAGERNGVYFGTGYGEEPGWHDISIENNLFWGLTFGVKIGLSETNVAMKVDDTRIINNSFYNTGESCIVACGPSLTIDGNSFYGGGTAGGAYPYAIWLYDFDTAPITNCVVSRNILDDKQGTPLITRFLYVQTDAVTPVAGLLVYDNEILSMAGTNAYEVAAGVLSVPLTTVVAGDAISPQRTSQRITGSGGAVTLTSTPTILAAADGVRLTLVGAGNDVVLQDNATLVGSLLSLGDATRTIQDGDVMVLRYDHDTTMWREESFTEASTGTGDLVRENGSTIPYFTYGEATGDTNTFDVGRVGTLVVTNSLDDMTIDRPHLSFALASAPTSATTTNWVIAFGGGTNNLHVLRIDMTNHVNFISSTNAAAGTNRFTTVYMYNNSGGNLTVNWNTNWRNVGVSAPPVTVTNAWSAVFAISSVGLTETNNWIGWKTTQNW